jgi:hypothetical protein
MFLRHKIRQKDGKEHHTFSVVENRRVAGGRVIQRHVLYLGEINDSQELAWRKSIEVFEEGAASLLVANGACTGSGSNARLWATCLAAISAWRRSISSMPVTTGCWPGD